MLAEGTEIATRNDRIEVTFDTDAEPDLIVVYTPIIEGTAMMFMFEYLRFLDLDVPNFNQRRCFIGSDGTISNYQGSGVTFTREGVHNGLYLSRQSSSYPIIVGGEWTWKALKIQN